MLRNLLSLLVCLVFSISIMAQSQRDIEIASKYINTHAKELQLKLTDVDEWVVSDHYMSDHNNVTHLYLLQAIDGIPIMNAMFGVHLQNDEVFFMNQSAIADIDSKVIKSSKQIQAEEAIYALAAELGYSSNERLKRVEVKNDKSFVYAPTSYSKSKILADLIYFQTPEGLQLVWKIDMDIPGNEYITARVNAESGALISKNDYTVYCSFGESVGHHHSDVCRSNKPYDVISFGEKPNSASPVLNEESMYRIYQAPIESPIYGTHELVNNPYDVIASPFGWHDTDGEDGAEYTITRGNNVYAFLDKDADDLSDGDEPDGGTDLFFDFPHDALSEPDVSDKAAQVNLFYMNNFLHDFTFHFGFNEKSGNFQATNYTGEGLGDDYVLAQAADGSGTNNANFSTPQDGGNGAMQMFLWGVNPDNILTISEPAILEGGYSALAANFGAPVTDDAVTAQVAIIKDANLDPTQGCNEAINGDELLGKIVIIDRGACDFDLKCGNAEAAGAIGAIVCNIPGVNGGTGEELVLMGGDGIPEVTIPSIFIGYNDCNKIKASIQAGISVTATIQLPQSNGPQQLDASYDNGVIAHEFGHGISNRLIGGPNNAGCLFNDEQMGEGWSDFFALVTSHEPGDAGVDSRGIGNYVDSKGPDGGGIRDFPYSTDMGISPKTYSSIVGTTAPHPLGEVWAATLWDLYWAMIDVYGYDPDLTNTESGNFKAILLVMDGMKMTSCGPGFVDGRDGILAADAADFDGENNCLIWEVFARRGVGFFADQGSNTDRNDLTENFEARPTCIKELKIRKTASGFIEIGGEIDVVLNIVNHKEEVSSNVVVTDVLPDGLTYISGSSNLEVEENGNILTWNLGDLQYEDEVEITYQLKSDEDYFSKAYYADDFEEDLGTWDYATNENEGFTTFWDYTTDYQYSGDYSWFIQNVVEETDNTLFMLESQPLIGDRPALKFRHFYNTEAGADGGFVSIQEDGSTAWVKLTADDGLRNTYPSNLQYATFAIPSLQAFSGNTNGEWIDSYFDLSAWSGKNVKVQFRFGTDDNTIPENGDPEGWGIDDVELIDVVSYSVETCVTDDAEDTACASANTFIDSKFVVGNKEKQLDSYAMNILPNPAKDQVNIQFTASQKENSRLTMRTMDGRLIYQEDLTIFAGTDVKTISLNDIPAGIYIVQLKGDKNNSVKKLVVE